MANDGSLRQVVIYRAASLPQAQLLRNLLEDAGIEAMVVNDALQGVSGELPLGWTTLARVVVAEVDAARARRLAEDFDIVASPYPNENDADSTALTEQTPLPVWPVCPQCDRRRTAVCPVCGTSGTDFPLGWGDATAGTVELNEATADLATDDEEAEDLLVICPGCDESFRPGFLQRCEWCGHPFEAGVEEDRGPPELLNPRTLATIGALVIIGAALFAYFAFILRV
ncbi:MAG: DUF2007 domain-containing protein [Planctomycetes bacterium]|nr:DUF2007 domain-containing protein [Planctomycetota bacterium]